MCMCRIGESGASVGIERVYTDRVEVVICRYRSGKHRSGRSSYL